MLTRDTGYRRYTAEQIPVAQIIRRFRALDMPLERIQAVLAAPDLDTRNQLISQHLDELQSELAQTQSAVASLRDLLDAPSSSRETGISFRRVEETPAAAITATISIEDAGAWYQGAIGELYGTLAAQNVVDAGPPGGIYSDDLFADERGQATVFVPCVGELRPWGALSSPSSQPSSWRRSPMPDRTTRSTGPTALSLPTSPDTRWPSTDPFVSTTSSAATTPETTWPGEPKSVGQSSAPASPNERPDSHDGRRPGIRMIECVA